jgi:hypothetical protein
MLLNISKNRIINTKMVTYAELSKARVGEEDCYYLYLSGLKEGIKVTDKDMTYIWRVINDGHEN